MESAVNILIGLFQDAWGVLVVFAGMALMIGLMVTLLKSTAAQALGADLITAHVILSGAGMFMFALLAFYGVPAIAKSIKVSAPSCGPLADLSNAAAMVIAAIGAIRMLYSVVLGLTMSAAGAPGGVSRAAVEIVSIALGMIAATVIVPIVTAFLGQC